MRKRLLVTGSQDWHDGELVSRLLKPLWIWQPDAILVSGGCPRGADALCERAWLHLGGEVERHPADWGRYGRSAGFRRSEQMVLLGADLCVAFGMPCRRAACASRSPDYGWTFHVSHGTGHCAQYAESYGIRVRRVEPIPVA